MVEFRLQFDAPPTAVTTPVGRIAPAEQAEDAAADKPDNKEALQAVNMLLTKVAEIDKVTQQRFAQWNEQVLGLATYIAKAIVRSDDELVQRRVCEYVEAAMNQLPSMSPKTVAVHPSCAKTLQDWIEKSEQGDLTIREDASVAPGDCFVEGDAGEVAAMMDAHFEAILRRFNEQ